MNIHPIVWFILFGAIFSVVMFLWSLYAQRRRRELIQAAATELGLEYFAEGDLDLINQLASFELFSQGRSREITNMIYGDAGDVKIGIFDYQYTTGSGKHKHTWRQSVASVESPELALPGFTLRPETIFHKIGSVIGYEDIDFESHPNFSSAYLLKGNDDEQVRAIFTEVVLNHFESQSGICVEGEGRRLIYYRPRRIVSPSDMRTLMEEGFKIFGLFRRGVK